MSVSSVTAKRASDSHYAILCPNPLILSRCTPIYYYAKRERLEAFTGMVREAQSGGLSAGGTIRLLPLGNAAEPFALRLL